MLLGMGWGGGLREEGLEFSNSSLFKSPHMEIRKETAESPKLVKTLKLEQGAVGEGDGGLHLGLRSPEVCDRRGQSPSPRAPALAAAVNASVCVCPACTFVLHANVKGRGFSPALAGSQDAGRNGRGLGNQVRVSAFPGGDRGPRHSPRAMHLVPWPRGKRRVLRRAMRHCLRRPGRSPFSRARV